MTRTKSPVEANRRGHLLLVAWLCLACSPASPDSAAMVAVDATLVRDRACEAVPCTVGVSLPLVTLRGDETGLTDPFFPINEHPDWGLLSPAQFQKGVALVWNWDGEVTRTIGAEGDGPGESNGMVSPFVDSTGRLHILGGDGRWSTFADDGGFLGSVNGLFAPGDLNVLIDDTIVVSGWAGRSQIRLTNLNSGAQTSFGIEGDLPPWPVAAANAPGEFWSFDASGQVIQRWSVQGEMLEEIQPSAKLLAPTTSEPMAVPPVQVLNGRVIGDLIWLIGVQRLEEAADPQFFVLVLNRDTGSPVATSLADEGAPVIHRFVNDTLAWTQVEGELGKLSFEVRRFGLVQ